MQASRVEQVLTAAVGCHLSSQRVICLVTWKHFNFKKSNRFKVTLTIRADRLHGTDADGSGLSWPPRSSVCHLPSTLQGRFHTTPPPTACCLPRSSEWMEVPSAAVRWHLCGVVSGRCHLKVTVTRAYWDMHAKNWESGSSFEGSPFLVAAHGRAAKMKMSVYRWSQ